MREEREAEEIAAHSDPVSIYSTIESGEQFTVCKFASDFTRQQAVENKNYVNLFQNSSHH